MKKIPHTFDASKTLLLLWMSHCLVDIMIGFWSVYKTLAQLDLAVAGLIAGISPFIGEGMQVLFGPLGDRGYRKALVIFGLGACSASIFLPYTTDYALLFLIYLLTCIGSGAFHPSAAATASTITKESKGFFISIFASGGAVGMAISHMLFSLCHHVYEGNTAILFVPVLLIMGIVLSTDMPNPVEEGTSKHLGIKTILGLFKQPSLVALYITQVCNQAVFWGLIFLLPDALIAKGYESWICFGGGHFFFILGGAAMMIPAGMLSDRYSPRSVLFFTGLSGLLLFYTFILSPLLMNAAVLGLLFCLGAALGVVSPVVIAFGNRMLPSRPGLVSAFLMGLAWCISESIGPGGGGILTACFEDLAAVKALGCFGFLFVSGMTATFFLPREVTEEIQLEKIPF